MVVEETSNVSVNDSEPMNNIEPSVVQQKHQSFERMYTLSKPTGKKKATTVELKLQQQSGQTITPTTYTVSSESRRALSYPDPHYEATNSYSAHKVRIGVQ
jgi:hypothetical protein